MKAIREILFGAIGWAALAASAAAAGDWAELQSGLQPGQVSQAIGVPLMRQAARGFETWIYEDGGCAQFADGRLTAWTAPKRPRAPTGRVLVTKVTPSPAVRPKARPVAVAAETRAAGQ